MVWLSASFVPLDLVNASPYLFRFSRHALRHYAASSWIEGGFAAKTAQTFAGHSSQVTMDRCRHLTIWRFRTNAEMFAHGAVIHRLGPVARSRPCAGALTCPPRLMCLWRVAGKSILNLSAAVWFTTKSNNELGAGTILKVPGDIFCQRIALTRSEASLPH
jgi:hypothetical protein